ncbi:MAG: addiction module protein [Pseudomonadota bacterium]
MSTELDQVISAAMQLCLEERAHLARKLLLSLDEPSASEVEMLWIEEAPRRLNEFRENPVIGIPAEEAFSRALDDIS